MKKAQKIKAEAFDFMQYFYRTVHDPIIHCYIEFSNTIDVIILKKAVTYSLETVSVINSTFDDSGNTPCWRKQHFTGDDIVKVIDADVNESDHGMRLLSSTIDIRQEPQLKIILIKGQSVSDQMCFIINHMVCDGAGFKEYLYLLADLYSELANDFSYRPKSCNYSRSEKQLINHLKLKEKFSLLLSKYDLSMQKQNVSLPLEGDNNNPFFVTQYITEGDFIRIKAFSKRKGVTMNDIILTSYARLLSRETKSDRIVIPCPVDLRKYLPKNHHCGICNLTSNYFCDIVIKEGELFCDTLMKVSEQMNIQKNSNQCLKSILMLEFVFKLLPFKVLQRNFRKLFTIPIISYTNLGVIDKQRIKFAAVDLNNIFLTGAIKYKPYFQIAVSSFDHKCTLSCNFYGTPHDKQRINTYLQEIINEILSVLPNEATFEG